MLTIKACRKLLPKSYESKSDKEIELMRNQYYQMAAFMFDVWHDAKHRPVLVVVSMQITYRATILTYPLSPSLACAKG
jgi:hypothetical protein